MTTENSLHKTDAGDLETSTEETVNADSLHPAGTVAADAETTQARIRTLLAGVTSKEQLEALMKELPHTADAVGMIRENLPVGPERARILNFATEILLDGWKRNSGKTGKIATLLSQTRENWQPTAEVADQLLEACRKAMTKDDVSRVATVQPLAYALGSLGHREFYSEWLQTTTMKPAWRETDLKRNKKYYASKEGKPRENQLAAIERHLNDANRTGLLRAHDIGLLFQIREEQLDEGRGSDDPEVMRTNALLRETVDVLEAHQQDELVAYIRQHRTI